MDAAALHGNLPSIPDEEFADRMRRFREKMTQNGLDLVVGFSNLEVPGSLFRGYSCPS
jgi:hypothetical protein